MSGCKMTRPLICRYVSVSCKLLFVVICCHDLPGSLEKVDLSSKLYVRVLSVKVVECVDFAILSRLR